MRLDAHQTTLGNGLRLISASMPQVESTAIGLWTRVGGRCEPARLSGISHFLEHLVFKGTRTRSAREIACEIEGRGGYYNAFTQEESTCFYAKVTPEAALDTLDILVDMMRRPSLRAGDVELERAVILDEITMYRDEAAQYVEDLLGELLWVRHPLGRTLTGDRRSVQAITRSDLVDFHQRWYRPGQTLVAFAGPLPHEVYERRARKLMGRWPEAPAPRYRPVIRSVGQHPFAWRGRDVEQTQVALGIRLFGRRDPRRYPLKLLSVLLGENMSSRLFQVLREQAGMAYSVQSAISLFEDSGSLVITAGVDSERLSRALTLIGRELRRLQERVVGRAELQRARDYAVGQIRTGLETSTSQMNWVGENLAGQGRFIQPQVVIDRLSAVTADQVQRTARAVLKRTRMSLALVGPRELPRHEQLLDLLHP